MVAERYRIVGLLGKGGMGEVYRADDLKLAQPVALKFLPEAFIRDGAALARFHREVRVARQVSHRNVCRVYDIGEVDGHHFLSMEYIKGEELSSLLRRIGRLPADKAVQLARQICAGLAAAHDSGVLHRDLKPSNIMIDDDGNARITDFGLAGFAEEFREEEVGAGTPAYMAPEQLDGHSVTARSDIYSLGLVLYELFTGKRAFEAPSLHDLLELRRGDSTPTSPTAIVKDLDPVIERVIDRCIAKNPASRPSSALQVAAALPGGDPIAAALAAGETPSPEMIAAAPKTGTLRPEVALGLFASVLVCVGVAMWLSGQVALHRLLPLTKSPEVLKESAIKIAHSLGYTDSPYDSAYGFNADSDYYWHLVGKRDSSIWVTAKHSQPSVLQVWYRQGSNTLLPFDDVHVTREDPPTTTAGMLLVITDLDGKLAYFEAVPQQVARVVDSQSGPSSAKSEDSLRDAKFDLLFQSAGLDIASFQAVTPEWTPPHAYDTRAAWTGVYPKIPEIPIRIEAASYLGRPVYFQIVSPWTRPTIDMPNAYTPSSRVFTWILLGVFFAILIVASFMALGNLRAGRGDRRGAFRVAMFLFLLRMGEWLFSAHHVATADEQMLLLTGLQSSLFWSCFGGLLYLALEPYLRRRWPQRIIAWNRLLAGDLRDPMIGRDILIGGALGALGVMLMHLRIAIPMWLGVNPGIPDLIDGFGTSLVGINSFARLLSNQVSASLLQGFMIVFLLLFLSLLLRKDWLGIGLGFLIIVSLFIAMVIENNHPIGVFISAVCAAMFVFCAVRFGPVALVFCLLFFHLWVFFPITTELNAWYAPVFLMDLVFLLGLAAFGFYTSLGGQPLFKGTILKED
jgi:serine/threonine-protein kinase